MPQYINLHRQCCENLKSKSEAELIVIYSTHEKITAYKNFFGYAESKRLIGKPKHGLGECIKMYSKDMCCENVDQIRVDGYRDPLRTLVVTNTNLRVAKKTANFLATCGAYQLLNKTGILRTTLKTIRRKETRIIYIQYTQSLCNTTTTYFDMWKQIFKISNRNRHWR